MDPEVWQAVEKSVKFLRKVKDVVKKYETKVDVNHSTGPLNVHEIQYCSPADSSKQCFNNCQRGGNKKYFWCYTSSTFSANNWDYCQCHIRPEILEWLKMSKEQLMKIQPKTPYKIQTDHVQSILIAVFGSVVLVIAISIASVWIHKYRLRSNNNDNQVDEN